MTKQSRKERNSGSSIGNVWPERHKKRRRGTDNVIRNTASDWMKDMRRQPERHRGENSSISGKRRSSVGDDPEKR